MQETTRVPKISIVIPTHNRADFIAETIQSVLDQTYTDWELIILDDASTDNTPQVVAQFDDERINYIYREKNVGETAARNAGITYARADILSFLDSDDLMLPHNLEVLMNLLEARPEVGVAYGWYYWMGLKGEPLMWDQPRIEGHIPPQIDVPWPEVALQPVGPTLEGQILAQLVLEETFMIGSALIRRECVEKIGGFDEGVKFQGHWDFYLRLARAGYIYACCRQGVALWRQHPGNRGLDKDGMLAHRLALLDRLLNDPALEASLADVRQQAYYNTYISFFGVYHRLGFVEKALECLGKAIEFVPERSAEVIKLTNAVMIAHHGSDSAGKDPLQFARDLFEPIPSTAHVRRLRRQVLGQISADLAFHHHQTGASAKVWSHALSAFIHDPVWLRNRGLLRIGLEGLVGPALVDQVRSRRVPVANNLLETMAEKTCIFISPHFDDVALSCGGTLAHLARRGAKILLVTVFTADLPEGQPIPPLASDLHKEWGEDKAPFKSRGLEEQNVANYLEAKVCWLNFLDAMYRYPDMKDWKEQFNPDFNPKLDASFEPVRDALGQIIGQHPEATVFVPLGLGYHRDHLIVHRAISDLREMNPTANRYFYYEDYPYAARADLQTRLNQLDWPAKALTIDIGETLPERVQLIEMYPSQLKALFGEAERVSIKVEEYATQVGSKANPKERFWLPQTNGSA